jgi:hypothetical protein
VDHPAKRRTGVAAGEMTEAKLPKGGWFRPEPLSRSPLSLVSGRSSGYDPTFGNEPPEKGNSSEELNKINGLASFDPEANPPAKSSTYELPPNLTSRMRTADLRSKRGRRVDAATIFILYIVIVAALGVVGWRVFG